jgi:hypothetical protein
MSENEFRTKSKPFLSGTDLLDKDARPRLYCPSSKVLQDVPRKIPPPAVLEARVQRVVNLCVMRIMLKREKFSSRKKHGRCTQMFCKLFAWDMLVTNPEWTISSVRQRQPERRRLGVYEAPHSLRGSTNISAMFSLDFTHLLALFVYRRNFDRAVERGLLPEETVDGTTTKLSTSSSRAMSMVMFAFRRVTRAVAARNIRDLQENCTCYASLLLSKGRCCMNSYWSC